MADRGPPDRSDGLDGMNAASMKMGSVSFESIDNNTGAAVGNAVNSRVTGTHVEARNINIYPDGGRAVGSSAAKRGPFFTVPFQKDKSFVGREKIMAELKRKVGKPDGYHTRAALIGTGGIGKSQIAIEHAYRVRRTSPNLSVFWVYTSSNTRFEKAYRDIAETLELPGRNEPKTNILQLVYLWLSNKANGSWLMILDNADDDSILNSADTDKKPLSAWIPQTDNGSVLVTSRDRTAAVNVIGEAGNIVKVDVMDMAEALDLLRSKHRYNESDTSAAEELVTALEYIPLAIVHAGSYLSSPTRITISRYLELIQESEENLTAMLDNGKIKDLRRDFSARVSVLKTWYISFKQIQESMPEASDLLALMSMFDRQGIPEILLQNDLDTLAFEDAISTLKGYSLIKQGQAEDMFDMHRLVQLSMREWLDSQDQLDKWIGISINTMRKVIPPFNQSLFPVLRLTLPHARAVIGSPPKDEVMLSKWGKVVLIVGMYLKLESKDVEAETMFRRGIEKLEREVGDEILVFFDGLFQALLGQQKDEEAEMICRQTLERCEKALGHRHPMTLERSGTLSSILADQGKHEEAEARQRRVLEETEKELGCEHRTTLLNLRVLADILRDQGRYDEAEEMFRRVVEKNKRVLGCNDFGTLASMDSLGLALCSQGKFKEAEAMFRQTLEGYEKVFGCNSLAALNHLAFLANTLSKQGKFEEAERMYRQALKGLETVLGPEHQRTLAISHDLDYTIRRQSSGEPPSTMNRIFRRVLEMMGVTRPDPL